MVCNMKKYEVAIYNKDVRDCIEDDKEHPQFDSGWAEQRYLQIDARDSDDARRGVHRRYPENKGFIIANILEIPDFE